MVYRKGLGLGILGWIPLILELTCNGSGGTGMKGAGVSVSGV
jgi:hypothetical protein